MANEFIMTEVQKLLTNRKDAIPVLLASFALVWTFAEQIRELCFRLYEFFGN